MTDERRPDDENEKDAELLGTEITGGVQVSPPHLDYRGARGSMPARRGPLEIGPPPEAPRDHRDPFDDSLNRLDHAFTNADEGPPPTPPIPPEDLPPPASLDDAPDEHGDLATDFRIGLLGGRKAGKSYLFQSMVYRSWGANQGALFIYSAPQPVTVKSRLNVTQGAAFQEAQLAKLTENYSEWRRLGATTGAMETWYRFRLPYRSGWLGNDTKAMELVFLDGSGELLSGLVQAADPVLWNEAFIKASVLILCLPMWAAFPDGPRLGGDQAALAARNDYLNDVSNVIGNYDALRRRAGATHPVQVVLALTQADSELANQAVRETWILPYLNNKDWYLRMLKTGGGVARYLASARAMSMYLSTLCREDSDVRVSALLKLDYGHGAPWFVPMSAIEGEKLDKVERNRQAGVPADPSAKPPIPIHVELPLLIALSQRHNALA